MDRLKLRIRFCKTGDLRLISHRDLARAFERLFRRAGLPLAMSQGFHPHARINFPSALALGIEGQQEVVEALLAEPIDAPTAQARLVEQAPAGLEIVRVEVFPASHPKPRVRRMTYRIDVPAARLSSVRQAVDQLLARESAPLRREGRYEPLELREALEQLELTGDRLEFSLLSTGKAQARPRDVLAAVGLEDFETQGMRLIRTCVELQDDPQPALPHQGLKKELS
jgi:radical SAM-linked protein